MRALAGELLSALRTRVELFGLEWQQARSQIAAMVGLLLAGVALLWLAAMMFSILLVTLAWGTPYRDWVVVGLLLLYTLSGLGCLWALSRRIERQEDLPFAATAHELSQDAHTLSRALERQIKGTQDTGSQGQERTP